MRQSLLSYLILTLLTAIAMAKKPVLVIVPGSWQLPTVWDGFRTLVRDVAGVESHHVALPTVGSDATPQPGLTDDVAAVRRVLEPLLDEGRKVVLLCHSSGGVVASNAVEGYDVAARRVAGKQGGVARVVYLAAFMLPQGQSLLDMLGGEPLPWMVVEGDRVSGDPSMFPEVGFNDMAPEDQQYWATQATWTSAALFAAPSAYEPWANGIPCSYIHTALDNALPLSYQQGMVQQLGPDPNVTTLQSGHCPFLSIPDALLAALKEVLVDEEE